MSYSMSFGWRRAAQRQRRDASADVLSALDERLARVEGLYAQKQTINDQLVSEAASLYDDAAALLQTIGDDDPAYGRLTSLMDDAAVRQKKTGASFTAHIFLTSDFWLLRASI